MRILMVIVSLVVVVLFSILFALTYFARDMVEEKAREVVAEKTAHYTGNAVNVAEEALKSPLADKWINREQREAFEAEILDYQSDPVAFVARLCASQKPIETEKKGRFSAFRKKIFGWKEALRKHYNETLAELLTDMRIFTGSNVIAGFMGLLLAYKSRGKGTGKLMVFCVLLLVSIGIGVYYYIDSMSFFTLLLKSYMGWNYPVFLWLTFACLFWRYLQCRSSFEQLCENKVSDVDEH